MQEELIKKAGKYLANTYNRYPITATKGEGCWLWDLEGRRYLDFLAGIAVCNLGHARKEVIDGLTAQAAKLFHVSNLFYMEPQVKAAQLLVENSFGDKVFFCNSGAEANEAAIKLARRYSWKRYGEGRHEIIVMENSFHGRTMATLSATGQFKFHEGFAPMLPGFVYVPFNNLSAAEKAINEKTCAVMLEPIQAEGGIYPADKEYFTALRTMTKEKDILMILDEVQTGMGRTGKFFAYEHYGVEPDIMSLAKALGNGFPVGAIVAKDEVMEAFVPGTHAATFGGNPLAASAVIATINALIDEGVIKHCEEIGQYLYQGLLSLKKKYPFIIDIRGMGLIRGIELSIDGDSIQREFMKEGIILNCTKGRILRLVPPLIVNKEEIDIFLETADRIFSKQPKGENG
ncbi:MAG: aspartate aminotransferase family protein [Syntrophus sp. (in: bacteria)]|nr:aspartate aminotransferase family protein [Syntrophus sp. (in: bacteria)]